MKCGKVKNPCKICLQSVSNRNGLQCKGACKKWAHFKCLNYTPGKISDIKAGLITITCPCPDCTTSEPREVLKKPPFTCVNEGCPATKPPACEVPDCPSKQKPIPSFTPPISNPTRPGSPGPPECPPVPIAPKCLTPPRKPSCISPPRIDSPRTASPRRIGSPPRTASPPKRNSPPRCPVALKGPLKLSATKSPCPSCPTHCPKSSKQKLTPDKLISPRRSQSCSLNAVGSSHSGKSRFGVPQCSSSDTALLNTQEQKMLFNTIEQMCDTVGELSSQLKDLMCKMLKVFQKRN